MNPSCPNCGQTESTTCANHIVEPVIAPQPPADKWAREAAEQEDGANVCTGAPQGVGKLSPEPRLICKHCGQLIKFFKHLGGANRYFHLELHEGSFYCDRSRADSPTAEPVAPLPMEGGDPRELPAKELNSNRKGGVEGVGQLASVEYWKAEAVYWQDRYGQTWDETLTLRAELQQRQIGQLNRALEAEQIIHHGCDKRLYELENAGRGESAESEQNQAANVLTEARSDQAPPLGTERPAKKWKPIIYGGTYYANVKTPERCPDCDGNLFISHGPKALICYICWLTDANDKLEAENAELRSRLQEAEKGPA